MYYYRRDVNNKNAANAIFLTFFSEKSNAALPFALSGQGIACEIKKQYFLIHGR